MGVVMGLVCGLAKEAMTMVRVRIKWGDYGEGVSDMVETYCCSLTPCYWVEFLCGYAGYFHVWDVEEL